MTARRTYKIGSSRLVLDEGSVLDVAADVVVSSDDFMLTMGGGVSAAIRDAAGSALVLDAAKAVPRKAGDVVVTTAGALPARYVFHVVTIGPDYRRSGPTEVDTEELVRNATRQCLHLAELLGVHSIVFPALGTGVARIRVEASAAAMAGVVSEVLAASSTSFEISIMLLGRTLSSPLQYLAFYEEFARRVPSLAARDVPSVAAPSAAPAPSLVSDVLGLEQQRQSLEQRLVDLRRQNVDGSEMEEVRRAIELNTDERIAAAEREHDARRNPVTMFVSYAHEDAVLRKRLYDHLGGLRAANLIKDWYDGEIIAGSSWAGEIRARMSEAEIVILVVTAAFLGSDFIRRVEMQDALERHRRGTAKVIPVIMRPVYWQDTDLSELQALPQDSEAVTSWADEDAALADVARGVGRAVRAVMAARTTHHDGVADDAPTIG